MRGLLLIGLLFLSPTLFAQSFTVLSWNIQDLGRSKDTEEINRMVSLLRDYDLVLIQEVVAKDPAGAQAIARIAGELDRTGADWDYRISDPTQSPSVYHSERYAFLWKTSELQLMGRPYLVEELVASCFREPYLAQFRHKDSGTAFSILNYHSRKHDDAPEEEIAEVIRFMQQFESMPILLGGDFNLTETHAVWRPLYNAGYVAALRNTPTTLKRTCKRGQYFNYAIDNLYLPKATFELLESDRVDFVESCETLSIDRGVSDHVPVWVRVSMKKKAD